MPYPSPPLTLVNTTITPNVLPGSLWHITQQSSTIFIPIGKYNLGNFEANMWTTSKSTTDSMSSKHNQ
ncbi:hypothetical protein C4D60_Mb07t24170 [Musa balbisiana]|uniref:Uncharacterized protein n=1 Tax=Musa balbisiana TaxID=52838 RepID=A0A4S8JHV7_MUSBA|nr:hypothetical protein C4D60_Mb07t24170 [Musa balbisiana]